MGRIMKDIYSDEVVFEFLSQFYQQCDFTRIPVGSARKIGETMKLTPKQSMDLAEYLVNEGYFTHRTMTGGLRLTEYGETVLKAHFGE